MKHSSGARRIGWIIFFIIAIALASIAGMVIAHGGMMAVVHLLFGEGG